MKSMLIDSTRCIGCRACQVACKEWNNLPAEKTEFFGGSGYQNPGRLSSKTWTVISFHEAETSTGDYDWIFAKQQCMHCLEPACAAACPVSALEQLKTGAVVYDPGKCIGCRNCQLVCPFDIPCFEWNKAVPEIKKCNFCVDRIEAGMEPSCSCACPTDAIVFGERENLLQKAEIRIANNPGKYVNHIYGRSEVGGTSVMHLAGVSFDKLGFRTNLSDSPVWDNAKPAMEAIPYVMTGLGTILGALAWFINRKTEIKAGKEVKND